jgi:hypothetical protein
MKHCSHFHTYLWSDEYGEDHEECTECGKVLMGKVTSNDYFTRWKDRSRKELRLH